MTKTVKTSHEKISTSKTLVSAINSISDNSVTLVYHDMEDLSIIRSIMHKGDLKFTQFIPNFTKVDRYLDKLESSTIIVCSIEDIIQLGQIVYLGEMIIVSTVKDISTISINSSSIKSDLSHIRKLSYVIDDQMCNDHHIILSKSASHKKSHINENITANHMNDNADFVSYVNDRFTNPSKTTYTTKSVDMSEYRVIGTMEGVMRLLGYDFWQ